ncbi:ferroxidase fet3, partial [Spiromyces aspiralis]
MLVRYLTSLLLLGPLALAKDIYLEWDIGYVNANPDGKFERQVIGCNGKFPFEPVEADYGDTLYINVHNSLSEVTSLHSHGIFFHGNNQFDGSPGVTECGIPPGRNFTYTIPLQQWGTYWIHSHSGPQYVDGWRTALIIKPPKDRRPVSYNGEYLLTVSDWFYESAVSLGKHYLSLKNPGGGEPSPNSALFNETVSPTLSFEPGNKYRIRIINYSAAAIFYFSVDGHDMEIIEIDGVDVEPTKAGTVEIAAAQRYSVLITAREDTSKNYLIHADLDVTKLDSIQAGLRPNLTATI